MIPCHAASKSRPSAAARRARPAPRGFTMIESIAAIVVLAAIGSVASTILLSAADGYADAATTAQLHVESTIGLGRVVREIRKIPLDGGAVGIAPDIDSVTASSITWSTNSSLTLSGSDLMLTLSGGTPAVLLSDVSAFSVATYDESDAALAASLSGAACDPIRRVEITGTLLRYGFSETLRTRVFIRSTMAGAGS